MHRRLGNATLSQLAFPGEGNPNFPSEKSHWNNTVVNSNNKRGAGGSKSKVKVMHVSHAVRDQTSAVMPGAHNSL